MPEPLKASLIVGVFAQELHKGLLRLRRCGPFAIVAVYWCHTRIVPDETSLLTYFEPFFVFGCGTSGRHPFLMLKPGTAATRGRSA